jgi:hypothetical protein
MVTKLEIMQQISKSLEGFDIPELKKEKVCQELFKSCMHITKTLKYDDFSTFLDFKTKAKDIAGRFEKEGFTVADYIKAIIKNPKISGDSIGTIEDNLRGLAGKFEKEGLTTNDCLEAFKKAPQVASLLPETGEHNIRGLVADFPKEGLTTEEYLKATKVAPTLFCLSPKTVGGHIRLIFSLFDKGVLPHTISRKAQLDKIRKHPVCMTLSDDNIALRHFYHLLVNPKPQITNLTKARGVVEKEITNTLTNPNPDLMSPEHANLLHRSLVRAGLMKGDINKIPKIHNYGGSALAI